MGEWSLLLRPSQKGIDCVLPLLGGLQGSTHPTSVWRIYRTNFAFSLQYLSFWRTLEGRTVSWSGTVHLALAQVVDYRSLACILIQPDLLDANRHLTDEAKVDVFRIVGEPVRYPASRPASPLTQCQLSRFEIFVKPSTARKNHIHSCWNINNQPCLEQSR